MGSHGPTAHAEINAIRKAGKILETHDLLGYKLYVIGYPYPMCLSAIIWANINEVYYGTDLQEAENIDFRDQEIYDFINGKDMNLIDMNQVNHEVCFELFNENDKKIKRFIKIQISF